MGTSLKYMILDAFRTHEIVAISDTHGNVQLQGFLLSLVRDARFPAAADDIVIETLSARYQDAIDRFVRGEDVPRDVLRKAWEDHTNAGTGGQIEEMLSAVRSSCTGRATCSAGRSSATTTCPRGRRRPS
jgi:hypothetical protein